MNLVALKSSPEKPPSEARNVSLNAPALSATGPVPSNAADEGADGRTAES